MPEWTGAQQQAIDAEEKTLLISAAAGSGKTAVLVERILQLVLRREARLNRMLIVTFTRAAAAEMRARLSEGLVKRIDAAEGEQLQLLSQAREELGSAVITTIDAFCTEAIRSQFQLLGIDPVFRVCDTQEETALFDESVREAVNSLLEGDDGDFHVLAAAFRMNDLFEMIHTVYRFIMKTDDPDAWLDLAVRQAECGSVYDHPWYHDLCALSALDADGLTAQAQALYAMLDEPGAPAKYTATVEGDLRITTAIAEALRGGAPEALQAVLHSEFGRLPPVRDNGDPALKDFKDRFTALRKNLKDAVKDLSDTFNFDPARQEKDLQVIGRMIRGLRTAVNEVRRVYAGVKRKHSLIDFEDMEQMMLTILRDEEARRSLQEQFDYIFVDECQDVSKSQDAIFRQLHSAENHLFMVGDVKQSIYRFRLADPLLFLERVRTYPTEAGSPQRKIVLQRNFRSAPPVLDASNRVFRLAMRRDVTEIDYTEEDELICSRHDLGAAPVEVHLVGPGETFQKRDALRAETLAVSRRIQALLGETITVDNQERPIQLRDICILMQNVSGQGEKVKKLLEEQGIPVYFDGKESYWELPEVRAMKALLEVVENPMQDLPLMAVLKLRCLGLDDHDLLQIRQRYPGRDVPFYQAFADCCEQHEDELGARCRAARDRLNGWRFRRETLSLTDFVWFLLRETGFYTDSGSLPQGRVRQANLRLLCSKTAAYEAAGGVSLRGLLQKLDQEMASGDSRSAKVLGENENLVRIMTMHKSKGLQFPVVILMRLSSAMMQNPRGLLQYQERMGLCLPYVNPELSIQRNTFATAAFRKQRRLDELSERCRLLYVAMTRAQNRLLLFGCPSERSVRLQSWFAPPSSYRVWSAETMLDWVMQAAADDLGLRDLPETAAAGGPWRIIPDALPEEQEKQQQVVAERLDAWIEQTLREQGQPDALRWWDEKAPDAAPLKTSVTNLVRREVLADPMPLSDEEESPESKRQPLTVTMPLQLPELKAHPDFMDEKHFTGADLGTAVHRLLSLIPLAPLRGVRPAAMNDLIRAELDDMTRRHIFTEEEQQHINVRKLTRFFTGPLGLRMLQSPEVQREWSFNLALRPEHTMLQGVIDSAWREVDGWVICDYKTDHIVSEEAFIQLHAEQLRWYGQAIRVLTGEPVKELWLWSLSNSKAYQVPLQRDAK